jgi:hypothetical protein
LLMQQLADEGGGGGDRSTQVAKRIKALEKELHTYKKLVRELRSRRGEHEEEAEERYRDPDHRSRRTYENDGQRSHHHREASHGHDPRTQGRVVTERERTHPSRHRQPLDETPRRRGGFRNEDDLERIEVLGGGGGGEGDSGDDGESTVSQIQPSHILQFQRRLARLHR